MAYLFINGIRTKKHGQGNGCINFSVDNLTEKQYNKLYLGLCEKYNCVQGFIYKSLFKDNINGYLQIKVQ